MAAGVFFQLLRYGLPLVVGVVCTGYTIYKINSSRRNLERALAYTSCPKCEICQGNINEDEAKIILSCEHVFHCRCLQAVAEFQVTTTCPITICRKKYNL